MSEESATDTGGAELAEAPAPAPVPLDERKEQRESTSAIWTRRISLATLVVSIFVAMLSAYNAQQNIRSNERQAAENLAASERQADENFERDQRREAYASFVTAANEMNAAALDLASKATATHLPDERMAYFERRGDEYDEKVDAALAKLDLLNFVASDAAFKTADQTMTALFDQSDKVTEALNMAKFRPLTLDEHNALWESINANKFPEALDDFIAAGRKDLGIEG